MALILALPGVRHVLAARRQLRSPGVFRAVTAAARGELLFELANSSAVWFTSIYTDLPLTRKISGSL